MAINPRYSRTPIKKEDEHKINEKIRVTEVRLVGEDVTPGVYSLADALKIAKDAQLDLVEISPNAVPPVCRVVDYSKYKYEQKRRQREMKAKQVKTVLKEIRFGPQTDDHDYAFKLKHAMTFLKENSKVKAYVQFVGRQIVFKNQGIELLAKFIKDLEDYGKPEADPKLEGKRMFVMIGPKTKVVK